MDECIPDYDNNHDADDDVHNDQKDNYSNEKKEEVRFSASVKRILQATSYEDDGLLGPSGLEVFDGELLMAAE